MDIKTYVLRCCCERDFPGTKVDDYVRHGKAEEFRQTDQLEHDGRCRRNRAPGKMTKFQDEVNAENTSQSNRLRKTY